LKEVDCAKIMEKCPYFLRCSAPLCPLDPDIEKRAYVKGDPTCHLPLKKLSLVFDGHFEKEYKKFIEICLEREARFIPLEKVFSSKRKKRVGEQLKMEFALGKD